MTDPKNPKEGAPTAGDSVPGAKDATPATLPKLEVKDGKYLLDGHSYVKESDLIAAKENLQKQLNEQQVVHSKAVDDLKLAVSGAQTEVASANAKLQEAEKARTTGAISADELAKVKKEADDAKAALAGAQTSGLDYRRKFIMAVYNIPADSDVAKKLMEKDMTSLDAFEEALKALGTPPGGGGPGRYIVGGGNGGAVKPTEMDRARAILDATPQRGVRNQVKK